eukprot:jgi/Chrzof1/10565/Cz05g03190.t1
MKVTHVLRRVVHGLMLPRSQGYPFHHVACHSGPGLPLTPSTANTCPLQFSSGRLPPAARVFMHHSVASMIPDIREVKQQARKRIKQRLRHLDSAQMATESEQICALVAQLPAFQQARTVGIYIHCPQLKEVDTGLILSAGIKQGHRCYVPLVADKHSNMHILHIESLHALHPAPPYGILEPLPTYSDSTPREDVLTMDRPLDILVMPGLGFDLMGRRLGRGGGYYDKYLDKLKHVSAAKGWPSPLFVALAFRAQIEDHIPTDEHDQVVDIIVTADQMYHCSERAKQLQTQQCTQTATEA